MSNDFDLSPLQKALASLEEILQQPKNKFIVAGTVQNFEFTFELSWKAMQRFLKLRGVETGSPAQVLRSAFQEKLISDLDLWMDFLKKRNLTVHTYNQNVAEEVYQAALIFPISVKTLITKLSVKP